MPRTPWMLTLSNAKPQGGLQQQLYRQLREMIRQGTVQPGEPLPSSRVLAQELNVSRNTVVAAYDRLLGEGYLESRERSGVYVCEALEAPPAPIKPRPSTRPQGNRARRTTAPLPPLGTPVPFHPSQPDVRLFPLGDWNRIRGRCLRKRGPGLLHYQSRYALGLPELRQALAEYLQASRGVRCDWQQIAVTSGSQQALFLLSQLILKRGDTVGMENPGYPGARQAFEWAGARLKAIEVDEQGAIPPRHPVSCRMIYVTPSRQFPTGARMPVARRLQWLARAASSRAWLIEDDYDSEFRYGHAPLPSLQSIDEAGCVIYLGSLSKVLFPSLRIGYVVVPEELLEPLESLRLLVDDHGPLIDQATLAEFIRSGNLYRHIRHCRKVYAERLETFLEAADRAGLPLNFPFVDGGLNQTGYFFSERYDDQGLARRLAMQGILARPLSSFAVGPTRPGLVLGFTAFEPPEIRKGVQQVARVIGAHRS